MLVINCHYYKLVHFGNEKYTVLDHRPVPSKQMFPPTRHLSFDAIGDITKRSVPDIFSVLCARINRTECDSFEPDLTDVLVHTPFFKTCYGSGYKIQ